MVLADSSDADIEKGYHMDADHSPLTEDEENSLKRWKRVCICLLAMLIFAGPIAIIILEIPIDYTELAVYPNEVLEH